jgi:hypothetical protein
VALGGVAFASIPDSSGTIHGCYKQNGGDLRVVESDADCRNNENALSWNGEDGRMSAAVGISQNDADSWVDPPANPDPSPGYSTQITTASQGRLLITSVDGGASFDCPLGGPSCHFDVGLYLDGEPLPGTGSSYDFGPGEGVGTRVPEAYLTESVSAGTHTVSLLTKHDAGSVTVGGRFAVTGPFDGS